MLYWPHKYDNHQATSFQLISLGTACPSCLQRSTITKSLKNIQNTSNHQNKPPRLLSPSRRPPRSVLNSFQSRQPLPLACLQNPSIHRPRRRTPCHLTKHHKTLQKHLQTHQNCVKRSPQGYSRKTTINQAISENKGLTCNALH